MANEISTPTLESGYLSNAFYKGEDGKDGKSAYEIAVEHGYAGTEEEWLAQLKPLIVQATKQAKADGDTSAEDTYTIDHNAKEIYDAAEAGRIVKLYVPTGSAMYPGGAYYQLSSYSYGSKTDKYTLRFTQPGSDSYESSPGNTNYQDGDGTAYLPGVRVRYIEGMLMAPDSTTLKGHDWSAYDTVPALDLVKTNIRAELAAETTRAEKAEKVNADAIATEVARAKAAETANADAVAAEIARAEAAEKTNADAISAVNSDLSNYCTKVEAADQVNKASTTTLDAAAKFALDGQNTTRIFWKFYPSALAAGETDKYAILCRFVTAAAQAWDSKTYTLRSYDAAVSGLSEMTPLDDLADKSAAQLCTASDAAVEDWADEDPMTWYIRANALSLEDGTMNITYFEGEDGFDITGEAAPVYTFALALWIKKWNDGAYNFKSYRTTKGPGFYPYAGDTAPDNTKRALTWHPTFPGGLNSKGALTSGAGIKPYLFASANGGITAARKMTAYEGLWNDCDTIWLLDMWQLRHFDLENSNIAEGCTNYNYQYMAALPEENVKRVLLTADQAARFIVGSTVSVGDMGTQSNKDRSNTWMRNLADLVKVSSIEKVTVSGTEYTAINLDINGTITTTATTCISTMPWYSGATELLPGRKDGCPHGLTNGTSPLRVAGVEVLDGAYAVGLDPLYTVTANAVSDWDYSIYECRDSQNLAGSVTSNYEDTGLLYEGRKSGWNYVKSFMKTKKGVLFPEEVDGSATTYFKSAFFGTDSAGVRCPWRFASLNNGALAGLACENGYHAPGNAFWVGRPRLCGAGKKRGEWTP